MAKTPQRSTSSRGSWRRRAATAVLVMATLYGVHLTLLWAIRLHIYDQGIVVSEQASLEVLDELQEGQLVPVADPRPKNGVAPDGLMPFVEIEPFDDDAKDWSNMSSLYPLGALTFDANGDGRLDFYFCQDGQNWTRPTDANGMLLDEPRPHRNGLYLNQGNDEQGYPIFQQVSELARGNDTYVAEELLVEDFLYPRSSVHDSVKRPGRQALTAVAADLNADGRPDLIVGNQMPGIFWSHPKTQHVLWPLVSPDGRQPKKTKQALPSQGPSLVDYKPRHNLHDQRRSARGLEAYGANSLYLNLGDQDGDGIPEWRDASREAGVEGSRTSISVAVADLDLDGDLDIFVANTMDPDYLPIGSKYWAGGANQLYINQLAQTGQLKFVERASEMDVDGVYDEDYPQPSLYRLRRIPFLPPEYSFLFLKYVPYKPPYLEIDGLEAERGQASWSTLFQDVNDDGYPDIWVANDWGYMRLYLNQGGERFVRTEHTAGKTTGNWMSLAAADFNGDTKEDLFAGNLGGAIFSHAFAGTDPFDLFDPVVGTATASAMFVNGAHDTRHVIVDGADFRSRLTAAVQHSAVLPPDASLPNNTRDFRTVPNGLPFDRHSLDPYEFAWGVAAFDVQNDGWLDFYYFGTLYGRGGGVSAILGTGPGRLLVNRGSSDTRVRFVDLTAEHHLFNIHELHYDRLASEGYVYRRAPTKNWSKRDVVYSYDRSTWTQQGPTIQQKIANHDLIQTSESGRSAIAADWNGDGALDLLLRNNGGYDSRASTATNLKVQIEGRPRVLPAHSYHWPVPTNYEPGSTRLFINRYRENHWLQIRLLDDSVGSFNRDAIGARVIVNGRLLQVQRAGEGGFVSSQLTPLHFGLGQERAVSVEIHWPDRARTITRESLDDLARGTLTLSKSRGVVEWLPSAPILEPLPVTRVAEKRSPRPTPTAPSRSSAEASP